MKTIDDLILESNKRLKQGNIRVKIDKKGTRLYLRGTFPPTPNSSKLKPYQQRMSLGVGATREGVKFAEAKAKEISALLDLDRFNWDDLRPSESEPDQPLSIGEWVELFRKDYFAKRAENPQSLTTWREDYQKPFNKLPLHTCLTEKTLREQILTTAPDTRQRKRVTLAYAALADFAGLSHSLRAFGGDYSAFKSLSPRDLPDDRLIITTYSMIKPAWQWVYGIMAAYGLRNHEVFFVDLADFPVLFVNRGKTNERYVWPIYLEWVEDWNLGEAKIPECSGKNNGDFGSRVTHAFRRAGCPFSPYNLRHAWAIRSLEFGLDISLAAAQMGHSLAVHSRIYHHWITRATHQKAMDLLLARSDRPRPPII